MSKLKSEKVGITKDKLIRNGVIYRRLEGPYFTGRMLMDGRTEYDVLFLKLIGF